MADGTNNTSDGGFWRLRHNDLAAALARRDLAGVQLRVYLALGDLIQGWGHERDVVSLSQIGEHAGVPLRKHVCRALSSLAKKGLYGYAPGRGQDVIRWVTWPAPTVPTLGNTSPGVPALGNTAVPSQGNTTVLAAGNVTVPALGTHQEEDKNRKKKKEEDSSEPPQTDGLEPPMSFTFPDYPCVGKGPAIYTLTQVKMDEYAVTFPGVDVPFEVRKAWQWCIDTRAKRKTFGGMPHFLNGWLTKAQNQAGAAGSRQPAFIDYSEMQRQADRKRRAAMLERVCSSREIKGTTEATEA